MRILMTGTTGFVGSHLIKMLSKGHHVSPLLRASSPAASDAPAKAGSIEPFLWDGSASSLREFVVSYNPDVIIHLASLFLGTHRYDQVEALIDSNVTMPTLLLDAASQSSCRYFLHTGSAWQHYNNQTYSPVNLYAALKQAFQDVISYYVEVVGFSALTLELTDTYGPGDPRAKLIPLLQKAALDRSPMTMSPGDQLLDYVHIDDVCRGYQQALTELMKLTPHEERRYSLRSLQPIKLRHFIELYNQLLKNPIPVEWGKKPYRPRETMLPLSVPDVLPNWMPLISLEEGLKNMGVLDASGRKT